MRSLLTFLGLSLVLSAFAQSPAERAGSAYQQQMNGQLDEAVAGYRALLTEGYRSSDLYFNLALACEQQQRLGFTVLYLEKAQRLAPSDAGIRSYLTQAYGQQADGMPPAPTFFLHDWWRQWAALLSPNAWGILALLLLVMAAVAVGLGTHYAKAAAAPAWWLPWQRKWPIVAGIALPLAVLVLALAWSRQQHLTDRTWAVVVSTTAQIYAAPGNDANIDATVNQGLKVKIIDTFKNWKKTELPDGRQGWILANRMGNVGL